MSVTCVSDGTCCHHHHHSADQVIALTNNEEMYMCCLTGSNVDVIKVRVTVCAR